MALRHDDKGQCACSSNYPKSDWHYKMLGALSPCAVLTLDQICHVLWVTTVVWTGVTWHLILRGGCDDWLDSCGVAQVDLFERSPRRYDVGLPAGANTRPRPGDATPVPPEVVPAVIPIPTNREYCDPQVGNSRGDPGKRSTKQKRLGALRTTQTSRRTEWQ